MKNTLYIVIALFLLGAGEAQAQKFAYVDIDALVKVMPQKDSIDAGNKAFLTEKETALQQMYSLYQRRVKEYQDAVASDTVGKDALEELAMGIKGMEDRINQNQQSVNQQIQDRAAAGEVFLIEVIRKACTKVAKAQGVTYIFDKGTLLAFEGGTDLTDAVSKELAKAKKTTPNNTPNNNTPKTPGGGGN